MTNRKKINNELQQFQISEPKQQRHVSEMYLKHYKIAVVMS